MLKLMEIVKERKFDGEQDNKRSKYSDGVCPKNCKDSSVKKMFIVGLFHEVKEEHSNIQKMLIHLKLYGLK